MKSNRILFVASLILLGVSFVSAQKVAVQTDPSADFTKYKTYSWQDGKALAPNPMMHQHIMDAVDAQLKAKGFTKASENADLVISYHVAVDQSVEWNSMGGFRGWGATSGSIEKVYTGQLVVDIADVANKRYLWRGTGTDTVTNDVTKTQKKVDKAVSKMFAKFGQQAK